MAERKKLLWLVSWYPNKLSLYEGDFIQRHARAVASLHDVEVIFVKKDEKGLITNRETEQVNESWPGLTERIIYYNPSKTKIGFVNKILSDTAYRYYYKVAILQYLKISGTPHAVHLHVAMRAGMLALWLKKNRKLNYILSEHWTGYLSEAKPNIRNFSSFYQTRWKDIIAGASAITVVSDLLGKALKLRFKITDYKVVPNVVDTDIFHPKQSIKSEQAPTKFVHVSSLEEQKDPHKIIEGFSILKKSGYHFSLIIYGPVNTKVREQVHQLGLDQDIIFKDEVSQNILAPDIQSADALVLFSKYETFGCVVIEANACGVPAILSNLDVFKEYSIENKTAVFAKQGDANALAGALQNFIDNKARFNKEDIAGYTKNKFSYEVVAKQFDELYQKYSQ